jgi:hypothetical protein
MPLLSTTRRRLAATASVVAVAGTGAVFVLTSGAFASAPKPSAPPTSSTTTTPSTSTTPSTAPAGSSGATCTTGAAGGRAGLLGHHGLLARTDYATFEIRRKGHFETVVLDRGDVTAVSSTDITVKRPDGVTVTIGLDPTTKYVGVSGESALRTGQHGSVVSVAGSALRVSQITKKS